MLKTFKELEVGDLFTVSSPEKFVGCSMVKKNETFAIVNEGIPDTEKGEGFHFKPEKQVNKVGHGYFKRGLKFVSMCSNCRLLKKFVPLYDSLEFFNRCVACNCCVPCHQSVPCDTRDR